MSFLGPTLGDVSTRKGIQTGLNSQLTNLNAQAGKTGKQRGSEFDTLMPGYKSLLDNGYSPTEKSAINQSTLGAVNESFGAAQDLAARRMARTGNSAGYGSFLSNTARGKAGALASQNLQNQKDFADETLRRKMAGLQGIANLYGVDTSFLNSLNQGQNSILNTGTNVYGIASGKQGRGFGAAFANSFGSGLGNLLTLQ